eukprot:6201129-Pyramimonas_sp.AAC.1
MASLLDLSESAPFDAAIQLPEVHAVRAVVGPDMTQRSVEMLYHVLGLVLGLSAHDYLARPR